jgi:hypothetical protein
MWLTRAEAALRPAAAANSSPQKAEDATSDLRRFRTTAAAAEAARARRKIKAAW